MTNNISQFIGRCVSSQASKAMAKKINKHVLIIPNEINAGNKKGEHGFFDGQKREMEKEWETERNSNTFFHV